MPEIAATTAGFIRAVMENLAPPGWKESQDPVSRQLKPAGKTENALRDAGKWETMRHYRLRFNAGDVYAARLDISCLARRAGRLEGAAPIVPFAVLVTVVDHDKTGRAFDAAAAEFGALRMMPRQRGRVRVRSGTKGDRSVWF